MKKLSSLGLILVTLLMVTGCELVGDIFQAGVGVGAFIVIAIIIGVILLVGKMFGK